MYKTEFIYEDTPAFLLSLGRQTHTCIPFLQRPASTPGFDDTLKALFLLIHRITFIKPSQSEETMRVTFSTASAPFSQERETGSPDMKVINTTVRCRINRPKDRLIWSECCFHFEPLEIRDRIVYRGRHPLLLSVSVWLRQTSRNISIVNRVCKPSGFGAK